MVLGQRQIKITCSHRSLGTARSRGACWLTGRVATGAGRMKAMGTLSGRLGLGRRPRFFFFCGGCCASSSAVATQRTQTVEWEVAHANKTRKRVRPFPGLWAIAPKERGGVGGGYQRLKWGRGRGWGHLRAGLQARGVGKRPGRPNGGRWSRSSASRLERP